MDAILVEWTKPFTVRYPNTDFFMKDRLILSTILSTLSWRKSNGNVKLYTDKQGLEYFAKLDILDLWNEIDIQALDNIPDTINADIFWAGGKIFALKNETKLPVVCIDDDLFTWSNIDSLIDSEHKLCAFYSETYTEYPYVDKPQLPTAPGYVFPDYFDWKIDPVNTAIMYINDAEFIQKYTTESINFMTNNNMNSDRTRNTVQMCFAEQRIFSMVAKSLNMDIKLLLKTYYDLQPYFHHLFTEKRAIDSSVIENFRFCTDTIKTILKENFNTNIESKLRAMPQMKKYFEFIDKESEA